MFNDPWCRRAIVFTVCGVVPVCLLTLLASLWFKDISNDAAFKIIGPNIDKLVDVLGTLVSVLVGIKYEQLRK